MSDTRRRRKSNNLGGSEDPSDSYDELNVTKDTQSSQVTQVDNKEHRGLRKRGGAQEKNKPQRKLDHDKDRHKPQYIPRRGKFYEHDVRTTEEVAKENVETLKKRKSKEKKARKDQEDRWDHDRYNDNEQAPKSHDELVAAYGYDIRYKEGPPGARQTKTYGHGPDKYTRNWEDEDPYRKPRGPPAVGRGGPKKNNRSGKEFPALGGSDKNDDLINKLKRMTVNNGGSFQQGNRQNKNSYPRSPGQVRPGTVPPRMQQQQQQQSPWQQSPRQQQPQQQQQQHDPAGNRPKRYSSLRQRPPVPEGPGQQGYQPRHGQHGYHPQAGNSRGVLESQGYPPGHFDQAAPVATPTAPIAGHPVLPLPPGGQPANFAPPPFLVPSSQFGLLQGPPPIIINYVLGPNGPAFRPNYQGYQSFSPPVQAQQGCTYYGPAQQQQHAVPMRKPKAQQRVVIENDDDINSAKPLDKIEIDNGEHELSKIDNNVVENIHENVEEAAA